MRQASSMPGSQHPLRRAAMWIGVLSLLISLITPIIQLHEAAAAQGEPPNCDPGYVVDETLGECVVDPNAELQPECPPGEVYDQGQGGCVVDPAQQPECDEGQIYDAAYGGCVPDPNAEEEPVAVQVEKYDCSDLDYDPYAASLDDLMSSCADNQSQVQLTVGSDAGEQSSQVSNYGEWTDLPAGSGYIAEGIPSGYGEPVVWCGVYVPNESQPSATKVSLQNGNAVSWQLEPGQYYYCWWFNIEEGGTGTGWIDFYKYECAYDAPTDEDVDYYQQECQAVEGWDFDVRWDGGGTTQTTDSSGLASWNEVPTGEWTGSETLPDGYGQPKVWCRYVEWPDEASYDSDWFPYDPSGGEITYQFEYDDVRIECWWFNFAPEQGGNWIDLYKYSCPYTAPHDEGKDYYDTECQAVEGWEFDVTWDGGGEAKTTGGDGLAAWSGVPQGDWQASESLPEGYGEPLVWCRYVEWPDDADYGQDWESFQVQGGNSFQHTFEYGSGVRIECHIYNFAPEGESWIELYKYTCPEGTSYETDASTLASECTTTADVSFTVDSGDYSEDQTTDGSGFATWSGVPTGSYTVSETVPQGYGDPIVYCRYTEWPDEATDLNDATFLVEAPGGQWSGEFGYGGTRIVCGIFNIPGANGSWIDFYKYECATDLDAGGGFEYYEQECEVVEGWDFDVRWDGGGTTQTTDDSGLASWSGVPTGSWGGSETLPEGYGQPLVWCRYVEWPDEADYNNDWQTFEVTDGSIGHEFEYDGIRFECYWFNFGAGDTNWIDFYKYTCPTGTTYDGGFEYYEEECSLYTEGAEFNVTWEGGGSSGTTDDAGYYGWEGVPVGSWQAQETIPEGYGDPVVWCRYVEWPEESGVNGDWIVFEAPGGLHDNAFGYGGMRIECYWFNIEYQQNWIDVTKWYCAETVTTPYEQSADNLAEECERYTDGVELTLDYTGGSVPMTTDGEGNAEWAEVPSGPWSLHEEVPEGYGDPVVWCRYVEWPEGAEGFTNDPASYGAPGGSFNGQFEGGGYRIHCDIFNIVDYDPGWVTVYKWYCAVGIPTDSSAEYLRDECDLVTTGVDFSLSYGETSVPMKTDTAGKAEWNGVPQGEWSLEESSATDYGTPIVWCQWTDWPTEADAEYTQDLYQPEVAGASFTGSHEYPGMRLVCYWFNFEYEGGDSEILIYKYWCEPGSAWGDELSAWEEGCPDTSDGTQFTLTGPSGSFTQATSGGSVRWTEVESGDFTVQEALPAGYEEPRLWCARYEYTPEMAVTLEELTFEAVETANGLWQGNLDEGSWRIVCYWFNIPGQENTFTVYKYNCDHAPVGYNTLDGWLEACPTKGNDVDFTLDHTGGSEAKTTADGKAEWTAVPAGEFTLTEGAHPGYGEPIVWCGWTAHSEDIVYDAFPAQVEAPAGVYQGEYTVPGTTWFCYWFNIPHEQSDITVYKYNCPDGMQVANTFDAHQEACTEWGDGIEFTLDNSGGSSTKAIAEGSATWNDVPQGEFTLTEEIPSGYGEPLWWCGFTGYEDGAIFDGFPQPVEAPEGVFSGSIDFEVTKYYCWVYNFPDYEREVTVYKWYCPEGLQPESEDYQDWADTCDDPMSGVSFELSWDGGSSSKHTNVGGKASWYGTEPGTHTLREYFLPGYEAPVVYCSLEATFDDGAAYAEAFTAYPVTDYSWSKDLDYAEYTWVCHVFNIPLGPGEITFYKWYCPPGYDVEKWGANPKEDCTQAQDGVPYVLDAPAGPNQNQETGDQVPGGVYFGDLDPGKYVVSEMVPADTAYVFIWDCTGGNIPKVHPKPLTWGNVLTLDIAGGDSIVCNWYNVPEPEEGWLTVYKYQCTTKTYVSDVDCETYEFGAEFELFAVDGNASQGTGITTPGGLYTWNGLAEGSYTLDEKDGEPCKVVPSKIDETGNPRVDAGQETVVKVYNCQPPSGGKKPGGKVPGKYPNTGFGLEPVPAPAAIQGDEGDEGEEEGDPDAGEDTGESELSGTPDAEEAAAEFYEIACLDTEGTDEPDAAQATEAPQEEGDETQDAEPASGEDASDLPPFLQPTGDEAGDEESDAAATEPADGEASPPAADVEEECARGAVPERMVIDAANVDHEVEILEIVDGVMQAPTGPNVVSWYKETARLGEQNNIVIAAHVNWWNVPEGPFAHLADLEEGDRIEITGEDGQTYVYEVQWVRQESNLEAPDAEVVGPTGEQSLTLITCGGEWDASISEYNERTVARAVQVEVIPAETPADTDQEAGTYRLAA